MSFSEQYRAPADIEYDSTAIGPDPWVPFLTELELRQAIDEQRRPDEPRSHYQRGLDAIENGSKLLPAPLADVCGRALYNSLAMECVRNAEQVSRVHRNPRMKRIVQPGSPPEVVRRLHCADGPTAIGYATLTHVGDWDAGRHIDQPVVAALQEDDEIGTELLLDEYPHVKLKTFDSTGQVIVVKHDVARHYDGSVLSRRRYMAGVDLADPDTDPDLVRAILKARERHKRNETEFDYERTRKTVGALLLPHLIERQPWIVPLRTSYYGVNVERAEAEAHARRKASK